MKKQSKKIYRVHIVGPPLFQEGALPFQRQVNLLYGMNIAANGQPVGHVEASERNYFRRYPGQPAVEISLSQSLPDQSERDMIYVCRVFGDKEWPSINLEGFQVAYQWKNTYQGMHIVKYERI